MNKLLLSFVGLLGLVAAFLVYSAATTFTSWPWTTARPVEVTDLIAFHLGETKEQSLVRAIEYQQKGAIVAVRPRGLPPKPVGSMFRGFELTLDDLRELAPADRWHVPIAGENAWVVLDFESDRLISAVRKDYRGPTE